MFIGSIRSNLDPFHKVRCFSSPSLIVKQSDAYTHVSIPCPFTQATHQSDMDTYTHARTQTGCSTLTQRCGGAWTVLAYAKQWKAWNMVCMRL